MVLLLQACSQGPEATREPEGPSAAPAPLPVAPLPVAPLPVPETGSRSRLVQLQIAERQAWHRRLLERPELSPEQRAEAYGELGTLYLAHDFQDAARACYEEAERLAPADPRWSYYLGQLHRRASRPEASAEQLERSLDLQEERPDLPEGAKVATLVRLGEALIDLDRGGRARLHLERALELDPECAAAHFGLGRIAATAADPATAAEHFAAALALQPDATAVHHPLGLAYRDLGRRALAEEHLARAGAEELVLHDPWMLRLHQLEEGYRQAAERGREALRAGRREEALRHLQAAVAADPLFSLPRLELARTLLEAGEAVAARRQLEIALELDPQSGDGHFLAGYLDDQGGRLEEAVAHYRRSVVADPEPPGARLNLARSLRHLGRFEEAAREYRRLVEAAPESRLVWLGLASALVGAGRCGEARIEVERGLLHLPRDGLLGQALARLLAACPDPAARDGERALEVARSLAAARADPGHLEAVAMALAELGRYSEAADWQRRALEALGAGHRLRPALAENLASFESSRPSRKPWPPTGLELFGVRD